MQRQMQALALLLRGEKFPMGLRRTRVSTFEVAAGSSEKVPYIGPGEGDISLSCRGVVGEPEEDIVP